MTLCPTCNSNLEYISDYGRWYCRYCRQYQQPLPHQPHPEQQPPAYQQPYQEPEPPPSSKWMIIGAVIVVIIIIVVILATVLISTSQDDGNGGGGKTVTMSVAEFEDNINIQHERDYRGYDNYIKVLFNSLEPGDTLLLKDEITDIYYNDWNETEIIIGNDRWYDFEGDLTDEFELGDMVVIEMHVIYISFDQTSDGTTYHNEGEIFQEQWNSELNEPRSVPLPRSIITKA